MLTVTNSTLSIGGGIHNQSRAELTNTIMAGNAAPSGPDCNGFASQGHNLIGNSTGCRFTPTVGDLVNVDPILSPLQYNGGLTLTHALLEGSPAIGAGDNESCPKTDQRGVVRPQGVACDVWAYEFGASAQTPPTAIDQTMLTNTGTALAVTLVGTDTEDCELSFSIVDGPTRGDLNVISDLPCTPGSPNVDQASVTFTPHTGFPGTDAFKFRVNDGALDSKVATVTVIVLGSRAVTKAADTDDGACDVDCSLREAIGAANSGDSIAVPAGTFTLTLGALPTIDKSLTLSGAGPGSTIIQASTAPPREGGSADYRVFTITDGDVNISGMSLRNGRGKDNGGGILNAGTLVLTNVSLAGNLADTSGGAIDNGGSLTMTNTTITHNVARFGGGIRNHLGATSTVNDSIISMSIADDSGGGIHNEGTLVLMNSTVSGNTANLDGGGVLNR